jgi:hypothetical protein
VSLGLSSATQEWLDSVTKVITATLSVSYDGGKTWRPVSLHNRHGGRRTADIRTPRTSGGFVSLRATAADGAGDSVSKEIIRAFGLS